MQNLPKKGKPQGWLPDGAALSKWAYQLYVGTQIALIFSVPAYAAGDTIWTKASEIMKDVYGQLVTISTIAAVMTACIALLLMNFSRNGRTVDESRAWLKRIAITWAIINGLGFVMAYITPFFEGGRYTV